MAWDRQRTGTILLVSLIGALIGTVFGKLLGLLIPALDRLLNAGGPLSVNLQMNLHVVNIGFHFNLASVVGVVAALLLFRRI